jgi:hypothetical protein
VVGASIKGNVLQLTIKLCRKMSDVDGPRMAQWFYEALLANETIKLEDIPYALDIAVMKLRDTGVPAARWATYMHLGA